MRTSRISALITMIALLFASTGCSHLTGTQETLHNDDYRKLADQKKRGGLPTEDKALKNAPNMTSSEFEQAGDRFLEQGNMESAFLYYNKVLAVNPADSRVHYKLGRILLKKGLAEEAGNEFQKILTFDAGFALAYDGLGRSYLAMKDLNRAEESFRKAVELNHSLWEDHNFLGFILDQERRNDEAISHYQQAIALKPELPYLFNNLGMSYLMKGDYEKAVRAFREALKSGDSNEKIYNNLGIALYRAGNKKEAFEAFKKGAGGEAGAYNNIGYLYLHDRNFDDARECFDRAIDLNPRYYEKAQENLKKADYSGGGTVLK